ncbi:MAG: response regulator [Rubrivivax sp.]
MSDNTLANHIQNALLVEGNDLMRSVAASQLRELGVQDVVAVGRIAAARERLERERYDLVMCSREFAGREESGQDLLDELRRAQLLPPDTVFVMVAAGATYQDVADAGEASIDGFLVRPYTTESLKRRLREAINRRRLLSPIFTALHDGEPGKAFSRALARFQSGESHAVYCGRLAAEMLLRFYRPDDAETLFRRIAANHTAAWPLLGVARAQSAAGKLTDAQETIELLRQSLPRNSDIGADAHELLGQILIEHGELNAALGHALLATEITPGCVIRAQIAGTLSFYLESPEQSIQHLERTCRLGSRSRLFNPLTWVLLAFARLGQGDAKALNAAQLGLVACVERRGDDETLSFMIRAVQALQLRAHRNHTAATELVRELSLLAEQDRFDLEAANVLLSLWALTPAEEWPADQRARIAQGLGLRLGVSKTATELRCLATGDQPEVVEALRVAQQQIVQFGQRGVQRAAGREPAGALAQLLEQAETTRNAKLFELASLGLTRHAARFTDAAQLAELTERAAQGLRLHAKAVSHIGGIQRAGRSAAGLPVRGWNHDASIKAMLPTMDLSSAAPANPTPLLPA